MEPRIQYAQTSDGVSIAFCVMGEGMPLVFMVGPAAGAYFQAAHMIPEIRMQQEGLARGRRLVDFDSRGQGLSQRDVSDYSLDAHMRDLEAVVDRLELRRFDLMALYGATPVAIAYSARNPERVAHLILWQAFAQATARLGRLPPALELLLDSDWLTFTEVLAHTVMGWAEGKGANAYAAMMREAVTAEGFRAQVEAMGQFDATEELPKVACPTLVLHRRGLRGRNRASAVAAGIRDARMVFLEGDSPSTYMGDLELVLRAIDEFLGEGAEAPAGAESPQPGGFRTILFTDIEGSTALTQRLGDAKAREVLREHERIVRECLRAHSGSEVKTMGDGFMASFASATRALECAIAMQRAFVEWNASLPAHPDPEQSRRVEGRAERQPPAHPSRASGRADRDAGVPVEPIRVRIGLNAGEPIAEEEDLFGTAVIVAARIAAQAQGGEILASNVVRELVAGKGFLFADRGDVALRGFEDPVRLYEVRWPEG